MSSSEELRRFIPSAVRSIWSLELLLLLRKDARAWSRGDLVATLRASDLVVVQALDSLVAAGLATIGEDGARFAPASPDLERLVDSTAELYSRRPDEVRRLIVMSSASGLSAFADAFRLRKD